MTTSRTSQSSFQSGITTPATAPTALAVTFTPVATTVTAASATATSAQACREKMQHAGSNHRPTVVNDGEVQALRVFVFISGNLLYQSNRTNAEPPLFHAGCISWPDVLHVDTLKRSQAG
ncbi:MAG: hypothetical protein WBI05_05255 [Rhodoferax sp.]|uniref:hypothetical protein n=1 Tax=Rhodoferax sp. TaxID=50421 RepID=UPI003C76D032